MIFNTGGGQPLNFKVVGGTAAPAAPAENTVWVNTDAQITSWAFAPAQPESPAGGMVWIATGTNSTLAFNALKKNSIMVYPQSARQYVGGAWVSKEAQIFQGGSWISTIPYLYRSGDGCEALTGGWQARAWAASSYFTAAAPTLTRNSANMVGSLTGAANALRSGVVECIRDIDLTGYDSIKIECSATGWSGSTVEGVVFCVCDRTGTYILDRIPARLDIIPAGTGSASRAVRELDVSNVTGTWDVCLALITTESYTSSVTVHNIWLE